MTATSAPFGMRPSRHLSGIPLRPHFLRQTKTLMEATPTLYQNQPVLLDATGRLAAGVAGAGNLLVGVFQGVEYTDLATGRPTIANQWVNGTLVKDLGSDSARVYFTRDPDIVYDIQASAAMAADDVGELGSIVGVSGNSTTGFSTSALDVTTLAATADQLKVLNLWLGVDNDWTDAYPIVQVVISQPQEYAALLGV